MGTELIDLLTVGTLMLARVLSGQACDRLQQALVLPIGKNFARKAFEHFAHVLMSSLYR
jgi:hypothetical protein